MPGSALHRHAVAATIRRVAAEQLIGLEAAIADAGALYGVTRRFVALRNAADNTFLPALTHLGQTLRALVRTMRLTDDAVAAAATQLMGLGAEWRARLEEVRASAHYQAALLAWADDRQAELLELLPLLFAGLKVVTSVPVLYLPVSAASGTRRSGNRPFLSVGECADRIAGLLGAGIPAESSGAEWWDRELAYISCTDSAEALDTPIALRLDAPHLRHAVYTIVDEGGLRIYTPRLQVPLSVVVASEATDEWWEAYEDSYAAFRDALRAELTARSYAVVGLADSAPQVRTDR